MNRRIAAFGLVCFVAPLLGAACALDEYGSIDLGGRQCLPQTSAPCYTGPSGTQAVGRCAVGIAVCRIDGTYGACVGEVLPAVEDCQTTADEDCDGVGYGDEECRCPPGALEPCETGALGVCATGKRHCADDGAAFGECIADAEPMPENCAIDADENCDGQAPACTGDPLLCQSAGGMLSDVAFAVSTNGVFHALAGVTSGNVFGRTVTTGEMYVDRRDAQLGLSWKVAGTSGMGGSAVARGVAVTPKGAVVAAGQFSGTLSVGGNALSSAGSDDIFVFGTNTFGNVLWTKSFGDAGYQAAYALALGPTGFIAIAGEAWGVVDFGSGAKVAQGGDAFVVLLGPQGSPAWNRVLGDAALQRVLGAAATPEEGDVLVVGELDGTLDTGNGTLVSSGGDAFVARLAFADGKTKWAQKFGDDALLQRAWAVASGPFGEVAITGEFGGSITVGQTKLVSDSATDAFVIVLEADGAFRWAKKLGDAAGLDQVGNGIAFDDAGNVIVTGNFDGSIDFGKGPVAAVGQTDVFVAKLAGKTGELVWAKRGGDGGEQRGFGVATSPGARVIVAGGFYGALDWGMPAMPVTSTGAADAFVTTFEP